MAAERRAVSDQAALFDAGLGRAAADMETLRRIHAGKVTRGTKAANVPLAHGLAYDPHVDGRLRLTPAGRAKLRSAL